MICLEEQDLLTETKISNCQFCGKELTKFQKKYCSHSCHFKQINDNKEKFMPVFTQEMHEIFEGIMLSDGNLEIQKDNRYARFVFGQGTDHRDYCDFVCDLFKCNRDRVTYRLMYQNKLNKYFDSYFFTTTVSPILTEYYNRWYKYCPIKNKMVKFIPEDFKITPLSLMHEFLGDGTAYMDGKYLRVQLSTHCFSQESIKRILYPQFHNLDIYPTMQKSPNIVNISNKLSIDNFYKYIGKQSPVKCYDYKFKYVSHMFV